jgi:hypothetical protein
MTATPTARRKVIPNAPLVFAAVILVAAIGTGALIAANGATSVSPTNTVVIVSPPRLTTLANVSQAIDALYRDHPNFTAFDASGVEYTPKTRDKVLNACSTGSVAANAAQLETERVMACAPLIYYFASYGHQNGVPEAIAAARKLYWYAATNNRTPRNLVGTLTGLLRNWGIH